LGYDEVMELAGAVEAASYVADMKRRVSQSGCDGWKGSGERPPLGYTSRIRRCD
jgi:hypothetical protein